MKTETTKKNKFEEAYMELNERKKGLLRTFFLKEHGYKSQDTWYKKLRGDSEIYINEKIWLAKEMQTTVDQLF